MTERDLLLTAEAPDGGAVWVVVEAPHGWSRRPAGYRGRLSLHTPFAAGQGEQAAGWGRIDIVVRHEGEAGTDPGGASSVVLPEERSHGYVEASALRSFAPEVHGQTPWIYLKRTLTPLAPSAIRSVQVDVTATLRRQEVERAPERLEEVQAIIESVRVVPNLIDEVPWMRQAVQWDDSPYGHASIVMPTHWKIERELEGKAMIIAGTGRDAGVRIVVREIAAADDESFDPDAGSSFGCRVIEGDERIARLSCGLASDPGDDAYFDVSIEHPRPIGGEAADGSYWRARQLVTAVSMRSALRSWSGGARSIAVPRPRPTPGP